MFQGLTLPALIRALGIAGVPTAGAETDEARRLAMQAALGRLADMRMVRVSSPEIEEDIARHNRKRLASLHSEQVEPDRRNFQERACYLEISRELLDVERETALRLRREGRIGSGALRKIERDPDLAAIRLTNAQVCRIDPARCCPMGPSAVAHPPSD